MTSDQISELRLPQDDQTKQLMDPYDPDRVIVPLDGRQRSPTKITCEDLATLMPNHFVSVNAVDAYMALLCHTFNGHFKETEQLPASPKWHAWPADTARILTEAVEKSAGIPDIPGWPPVLYPEARLQNVGCHFFPVYSRMESHFYLLMLQKANNGWQCQLFSSDENFKTADFWLVIREYLYAVSGQSLDLRHVALNPVAGQPLQDVKFDNGVFVLGAVRQLLTTRSLGELEQSWIPALRKRILYELQCWEEIV